MTKTAYIGPADGDTAEELGEVPPCLRNSLARSQVVAGLLTKSYCLYQQQIYHQLHIAKWQTLVPHERCENTILYQI